MAATLLDNPYRLLGVERDASEKAIKHAYKKQAKIVHPDKNPDDPEAETRFRDLHKAYERLLDAKERAKIDSALNLEESVKKRAHAQCASKRKFADELQHREKTASGVKTASRDVQREVDAEDIHRQRIKRLREENRQFTRNFLSVDENRKSAFKPPSNSYEKSGSEREDVRHRRFDGINLSASPFDAPSMTSPPTTQTSSAPRTHGPANLSFAELEMRTMERLRKAAARQKQNGSAQPLVQNEV